MATDNYNPETSRTLYHPSASNQIARLWAREKTLHDLSDFGAVDFFEGSGTNPTGLPGYATNKLWLRVDDGVTETCGTVRYYAGGDPTLLASWPELTREGYSAHIGARSGAEFDFVWSTATSGDPGSGRVRGNNASLASITEIAISKTGRQGQAYASRIATWLISDIIRIYAVGNDSSFVDVSATAVPVDAGTYYTVACSVRAASTLANGVLAGVGHWPTSLAIDAAGVATAQAAIATAAAADASADASSADAARIAAEAGAASSVANGTLYANEATGRAAVSDGVIFRAVGASDVSAIDIWQRVNSSTSTLLRSYPSTRNAPLQLFPDPYFDITAGDTSRRFLSRSLYDGTFNNRQWIADFTHSMGVGAWRALASNPNLCGFNVPFGGAIRTDDSVSLGIIVRAATGTTITVGARFYAVQPATWVGGQYAGATIAASGGEDLITLPLTAIPSGATGVALYVVDGATAGDINILSVWAHLNEAAGSRPSPRMRADAISWVHEIRGGERSTIVAAGLKPITTVTHSGSSIVQSTTAGSIVVFGSPFSGWGDSYTTPGSISFNAVRLPAVTRSSTVKAARIKIVVRADATNPRAANTSVVGVGEVFVDEDSTATSDVVVLMRDPYSGALKTLTEADLSTYFSVAYYAMQRDGTPAYLNTQHGTISGLTRQTSFYLTDADDPLVSSYASYSGNPTLSIGLELLTSPVATTEAAPTSAFASRLGLSSSALTTPSPYAPTLAPRIFGMVGREMNVYLGSSHSTAREMAYDVTCSLGKQQADRWTHTPVAIADNVAFSLNVVDVDHLSVSGTTTATIDVASATAAAGANKRVLCIGDSTTDAGTYTQRLLDIAAANASAAQITLMGTRGTGSNKHEGRDGWTLANYWDQDSVSGVDNPFVTGAAKFNMAAYLTATSQAAPNIVFWHLGINDVFSETTDGVVNSIMTTWLDRIRRMIGITADATVGSVIESNASAVNIVALPIMPAGSQDAFGENYANGQTWRRYRRNIALASYRIRQDLGSLEGSKVFLLPWNVTIDPIWGFPATTAAANSTASDTVRRLNNGVHPAAAGYNQMGDSLYACINWLVAKGHI